MTFVPKIRTAAALALLTALLISEFGVPLKSCAAQESIPWRTGAELKRHLSAASLSTTWSQTPLRRLLTTLSQHERVALVLDRRVDPDQLVDFAARDDTIEKLLAKLTVQLHLGYCFVGSVVYVGPEDTAGKLATLVELKRASLAVLPLEAKRDLVKIVPSHWGQLATPRELIEQVAAQGGVKVEGLERIPHDLWPAVDLPDLAFIDRMSIVLAGFGLTFEFAPDGTTVQLQPIPAEVAIEKFYPVSNARISAAAIAKMFPNAEIRTEGRAVVVVASIEDHKLVADLLKGKPVRRVTKGDAVKTYTIKGEDAVGGLAKLVATQLDVELKYDAELLPKLKQRVSIDVNEGKLGELLKAILDPVDLDYKLTEETLTIVPIR